MKKNRIILIFTMVFLICFLLTGCGSSEPVSEKTEGENQGKGLYFNGVGPIPAKVIISSNNLLSVEVSDVDVEEILDELGK